MRGAKAARASATEHAPSFASQQAEPRRVPRGSSVVGFEVAQMPLESARVHSILQKACVIGRNEQARARVDDRPRTFAGGVVLGDAYDLACTVHTYISASGRL